MAKTDWNLHDTVHPEDMNALGSEINRQGTGISKLEDRLNIAEYEDITLQPGLQVINSKRDSRFRLGEIKGRTLINLLGDAGGCETLTSWTANGAIISLDSANYLYGSKSLKVTSNGAGTWGGSAWVQIALDKAKYYVLLADVLNNDATAGYIMLEAKGVRNYDGNKISSTDKFSPSYIAISPNSMVNATSFCLHGLINSGSGSSAYFDGFRIYEITSADYAALNGMTADQIAAKYPFVSSGIIGVENPYVIRYGENLLPPFYEWSLGGLGKIISPYKLSTTATASSDASGYTVKVEPNTSYTYSAKVNGRTSIFEHDVSGKVTATHYSTSENENRDIVATFVTSPNAVDIQVFATNTGAGTFTLENPMLTLGTTPKPFKPRRDTMLSLQTELHANPVDGSDPDVLFEREGQYFKLAKWKKVVLDESHTWTLTNRNIGYVKVRLNTLVTSVVGISTKYDGKQLTTIADNAIGQADQISFSGDYVRITVSNVDSGWGVSYTPTPDEIKAYYLGWKMAHSNGVSPFTESDVVTNGGKVWIPILGFDGGNGTAALPTSLSITSVANGWKPYQLINRLTKETVEPVVSEGCLTLHEGNNVVAVGTGIVLREHANPVANGSDFNINNANFSNSKVQYKTERILSLYKNNRTDNRWQIFNWGAPYGKEGLYTLASNFDQLASYSVTYTKLDKSPIQPITGTLASNEKAQIIDLTAGVIEALQRVSVVEMKKGEKDGPGWINPTLLNGWSNIGGVNTPAGYFRDSQGFVHLRGTIKGGAVISWATLFKLPPNYRPKYNMTLVVSSNGLDGMPVHGVISINSLGDVQLYSGSNSSLALDSIPPFLSEL